MYQISPDCPSNQDILLSNFEGLEPVLVEAIHDFIRLSPEWLDTIKNSIALDDPLAVSRAAHALKGAASNFQAIGVHRATQNLEVLGRSGHLSGANDLFNDVEVEMTRLVRYLQVLAEDLRSL